MDSNSKRKLLICRETDIICTGGVVFIGDGAVGKTHTALNLASYRQGAFYNADCTNLAKSVNLEFDYFILYSNIEKYKVTISSQLYIMPGQKGKAEAGEGLAFEDAIDMYFNVRSINDIIALILTYSVADIRTFQNLEYWLNRSIDHELISDYTSIILLGTHQDHVMASDVSSKMVLEGEEFVKNHISEKLGIEMGLDRMSSVTISNTHRTGIDELQESVSKAFFRAFEIEKVIQKGDCD